MSGLIIGRRAVVAAGGAAMGLGVAGEAGARTPNEGSRAMSFEETLQELKDRTDILEVAYAYCRHADNLDAEGMIAQFTDDCIVNYVASDDGMAMRGKDALRRMLTDYFQSSASSAHYITNAEFRFEGADRAVMHCYMYSWQRFKGHPATADCHRWGRYETQFVRTRHGWRMSRLRLLSMGEYGGDRIGEHFARPFPPRFD